MELLTITIYRSTIHEIIHALRYIAYAAAVRQHQDADAPQPPLFTTQILNDSQLSPHVPIVEGCIYYGVCAEVPDPLLQIGERLLTVMIKPVCGNAWCLAVWRHPLFPLTIKEIHALFARYFGARLLPGELAWSVACPPDFSADWPDAMPLPQPKHPCPPDSSAVDPADLAQSLPLTMAQGDAVDSTAAPMETQAAPAALRYRAAGAPPKESTRWLQQQIEARGGLTAATADLYDGWLEFHECEADYKLRDPRRSFESAVETAMSRIKRKRAAPSQTNQSQT